VNFEKKSLTGLKQEEATVIARLKQHIQAGFNDEHPLIVASRLHLQQIRTAISTRQTSLVKAA
jgi:hypothetical protein